MRGSGTGRRDAAVLVAVVAAAIGGWRFAVLAAHHSQPAYAMPPLVVVIGGVALAVVVVGAIATVRSSRVDVPALSVLATLLIAFGLLAILSVGLPILVLGIVLTATVARRWPNGASRWLLVSGPVLAVGIVGLIVLSAQQPVVTCETEGVSTATPLWLGGGGSSGSGEGSSASSVHSGTETLGTQTFAYVCDGDRLVDFHH